MLSESAWLVIVGVIHLMPLSGVLGAESLTALYGLPFDEPNLAILMRHRAVLFGLLGAFLLWAAFRPPFRVAAFVAGHGYLGEILRLFGVPATTRNWNTIAAIAKGAGRGEDVTDGEALTGMRAVHEVLPNRPIQRTAFGPRRSAARWSDRWSNHT